MRAFGFHVDKGSGFAQRALSADDETVAVVGAAIGHIIALRAADFVAGEVCWGEELDFCNNNCFVLSGDGVRRGVGDLIGGDEERVCWGVEYAGFVEVGGSGVGNQDLKGWIGTEEVVEGVMED